MFENQTKKCLVIDLDNTLWRGIVGEDGFDEVKPFVEFQRAILALYERGVILAINSSNNEADAMQVIREHPDMLLRENNFACIKINWEDKVSNMKAIASELNIGLDSMVYFDDDVVNRARISYMLPVFTPELPEDPRLYAQTLMNLDCFNVFNITEEDKRRGQMYAEEKNRWALEQSLSLEEFIAELNIKINIKKADACTIPRIAQLIAKTNQFNLTTIRFTEQEIRKFSLDKNWFVGCAHTSDRFGDNGITGVFIVRKVSKWNWNIVTFLLSCRVMGRRIEDGMMRYICDEAKAEGIQKIRALYIPTAKNNPCKDFLPRSGFKREGHLFIKCII